MLHISLSILFTLLASAFCSVSEAAFYSVPRSTVEKLRHQGTRSGRYLADIKEHIDRYIASVLICNTLANTLGVFIATTLAIKHLGATGQFVMPVVLTILILLFGEIVPKTIGVRRAATLAPKLSIPFYVITILLGWTGLIKLCLTLTNRLTAEKTPKAEVSLEDIHSLSNLGVREGIIDRQQAEVIKNILGLKSMTVRKVMTPRQVVFSLSAEQTIGDSLAERGNWPFSRVPLFGSSKDQWIGIVLRRDIYNMLAEGKRDLPLRKFMRPIQLVPDSLTLDKLLHRFLKQRGHIVGVVDEYGAIAGIATLEDVLEGILGREIVDEYDETVDLQEQARRKSLALAAISLRRDG